MRRPAVLLFGLVACWTAHDTSPQQPIANRAAPAASPLAGSYWCKITEGDFTYPEFPCAIRQASGHLVLAKLAGSVRFEGEVAPAAAGFSFHGRMFCPFGDCEQQIDGSFVARGGHYVGSFQQDQMVVELSHAPDGAFGGAGYGGETYGNAGRNRGR